MTLRLVLLYFCANPLRCAFAIVTLASDKGIVKTGELLHLLYVKADAYNYALTMTSQ